MIDTQLGRYYFPILGGYTCVLRCSPQYAFVNGFYPVFKNTITSCVVRSSDGYVVVRSLQSGYFDLIYN